MKRPTPSATKNRLIIGLAVACISTLALLGLEAQFRPIANQGLYFQYWSSEIMMQTVSVEDLRNDPIRSLFYLHIQPPAFDTIRAFLAQLSTSTNPAVLIVDVDRSILFLWAFLNGAVVFVIFWWLSDITAIGFAGISALLFSVHPASIFYATTLDTTTLSAFLILLFCYLLWRIKERQSVSMWALAGCFLSLFFTRPIFQWPWLLILPICLLLLRLHVRKMLMFMALSGVVIGLYTAKQISLFGISLTSSFTGLNLANSIGLANAWKYYGKDAAPQEVTPLPTPSVLSRVWKFDGSLNYNNSHYLEINRLLQYESLQHLLNSPYRQLLRRVLGNAKIYLQPSSSYTTHIIVDRLPWRSAYDCVASFPLLPLLVLAASVFWLARSDKSEWPRAIGLCLPVACIAMISILFERGENMRFKFFIEPVLFVFLASQVYAAGRYVIRTVLRNRSEPHTSIN